MRDVVLLQFLSLDGVAEEPSDWMFDDGPELFALVGDVIATQDDVLLGRGTYDYWAGHWPTSDLEPFAPFINATTKHVATSSPLTPGWSNSVVMDRPVLDYVQDLRRGPGRDIGVHGSTLLARSLLHAGLVDRLRIVMPSNVAGHGRRLFDTDGDAGLQRFTLSSVEATPGGTLLLDYRRAGVSDAA